jgi:TolB-like protein
MTSGTNGGTGPGPFAFLQRLRERNMVRYVVAYLAAGWLVLQVIGELGDNGILPRVVFRAGFALYLTALPGALIVAWFHGAEGRQDVPRIEKILLGLVGVVALLATGLVVRANLAAADDSARRVELPPDEDPTRVAVLYFEPRGGDDAEFLAAGLTEALIDELSGIEALHVVSRNGSQLFRGSTAPPDSMGRTLQAGTLVGGTVAQAGERVRVEVTMTNPTSGDQFASVRLERPRAEIFTLQDQLADTVAVFLRSKIGIELGERRLRAGAANAEAWELVQRADKAEDDAGVLIANGDPDAAGRSFDAADSLLAAAEAADGGWVEPTVRRGWLAYRRSRLGGMDRNASAQWIERGIEHAGRAVSRDSTGAGAREAHATLLYWKYLLNLAATPEEAQRLYDSAEAGFRAAIAADRNRASALASLSHLLLNRGDIPEAKLSALQAYQADPFLENTNLTIWRIFTSSWSLGDGVEARRYCDEGVRRYPADFRFAQCRLMLLGLPDQTPDPAAAWPLVEEFAARSPQQVSAVNRQRGLMYIAMGLARLGLADSAAAVAVQGRADPEIDPLREVAFLESIVRTQLGDAEEAVRQLSAYLAANPGARESYRRDAERREMPWYHRALLDEPRFRSLVGLR